MNRMFFRRLFFVLEEIKHLSLSCGPFGLEVHVVVSLVLFSDEGNPNLKLA